MMDQTQQGADTGASLPAPNQKTWKGNPIKMVDVTIVGKHGSRLVVRQFSDKAKDEIRAKQAKKAKLAKAARDTDAEYLEARYVDEELRECVPITALKKAIVSAAAAFDDLTKVGIRQAVFVDSIVNPGSMLVPIELPDGGGFATGVKREDAVTLSMNTRGLAYRPEYPNWMLRLRIEYNERLLSEDQLLALVDHAGWGIGICEGRPEKTSALGWGRFERVVEPAK